MSEGGKAIAESFHGHHIVRLSTGEVLDLSNCDEATLVQMMEEINLKDEEIRSYKEAVSDELIRRMDQAAAWTIREGDWEVTAPSPTAGTTEYLPDALAGVLSGLPIDRDAAERALQRHIILDLIVPLDADTPRTIETIKSGDMKIGEVDVRVASVERREKVFLSGIRALEKVPGCKEALEAASVAVSPPRRKVKVSRKR